MEIILLIVIVILLAALLGLVVMLKSTSNALHDKVDVLISDIAEVSVKANEAATKAADAAARAAAPPPPAPVPPPPDPPAGAAPAPISFPPTGVKMPTVSVAAPPPGSGESKLPSVLFEPEPTTDERPVSAEEQARMNLQQSVEHVRQRHSQRDEPSAALPETPPPAPAPSTDTMTIDCPSCEHAFSVSNTDTGTRYVCPECGTPIRFED